MLVSTVQPKGVQRRKKQTPVTLYEMQLGAEARVADTTPMVLVWALAWPEAHASARAARNLARWTVAALMSASPVLLHHRNGLIDVRHAVDHRSAIDHDGRNAFQLVVPRQRNPVGTVEHGGRDPFLDLCLVRRGVGP